jgi:exopolysaccharide production protein ExoQ
MKTSKSDPRRIPTLAGYTIIAIALLITNRSLWLCLKDYSDPLSFCAYRNIYIELALYILASLAAAWLMFRAELVSSFIQKWKKNGLVFLFVIFASLSLIWSILPAVTLYHVLILWFTSFVASYIGSTYSNQKILTFLFWFAAITVVASYVLLLFFPNAAIMAEPHLGSWRGVYWHKNFTGSLMAFANSIFLLYGLTSSRDEKGRIVVTVILYLLSAVFTIFSKSAAGVIIWVALNALLLCVQAWRKIRNRLTRRHYIIAGSGVFILGLIAALNLGTLLGLLNRESSFTGRMPLWNYLYREWITKQLLFGYGHDAFWYAEDHLSKVNRSLGWSFTINNSHNGFIDITLGLGVIGLLLATVILILAAYRSIKYLMAATEPESTLPLLITTYFLLANLTISFFLWFESFHWFLLIIAIFVTTPPFSRSLFRSEQPISSSQ